MSDKYSGTESDQAKRMLDAANVTYEKMKEIAIT